MKEKFSTIQKIHNEVKSFSRLKSKMEFYYEGTIYSLKNHPFNYNWVLSSQLLLFVFYY